MAICLAAALPCVILPPLLTGSLEKGKPLAQQYWVKANVWIAIFSFIGNYFWTHYFYDLLGAEYTFPSWQLNKVVQCQAASYRSAQVQCLFTLNDGLGGRIAGKLICEHSQVPIPLYFMTHAYFCFYHALSNVVIRRTRNATAKYGSTMQNAATALVVFLLAYATAFMETLTIAHFPYYKFKVIPARPLSVDLQTRISQDQACRWLDEGVYAVCRTAHGCTLWAPSFMPSTFSFPSRCFSSWTNHSGSGVWGVPRQTLWQQACWSQSS